MTRFLRLLKFATYPFLGLSLLLLMGLGFGAAFVSEFIIENRTESPIAVTPVGTVGRAGKKAPLPVTLFKFLPLPALRSGGYHLAPGEFITVQYDMDDINFSEIVVEAEPSRKLQLVIDANPTSNQYHAALQRHYVIDDLSQLDQAPISVQVAAQAASGQWVVACVMLSLLFGPGLIYGIAVWLSGTL